MRIVSFLLSIIFCSLSLSAHNLDLRSLSSIRNYDLFASSGSSLKKVPSQFSLQPKSLAFVTLRDGFSPDDLLEEDVKVLSSARNVLIVELNIADAETISQLDCVKSLQLQRPLSTRMDKARECQQIDDILFASPQSGLSRPFTGKGVIAGIVDQGFDPHHINFRYANGESRISFLTWLHYNSSGSSIVEDQFNYTNIKDFSTDLASAYHGTHTLGIMAGSYNGEVTLFDDESSSLKSVLNPYYGVAPEADIAVSCGDLTDAAIALGINNLLDYKDFTGQPMVINLSLGSNSGPHDPNSQMARFLSEAGNEAVICVAAGNEGDMKIALKKCFSEEDHSVKTLIYPCGFQYSPDVPDSFTARSGSVEVWSADDTPFEIKAVIYNRLRDYRAAYNMPVAAEDMGTYYCSSSDYMVSSSDIVGDPTFAKAFEGYVGVGKKLDQQTGRYYGLIDYYIFNNPESNLNDDYVLGFEVSGIPGQSVECYGDGANTWMDSYGVEGFDDGSCDGSISDLAVAHNILVVGAYNSRDAWMCLDGNSVFDSSLSPGLVSGFSSFASLSDGRSLPDVCGPGSTVISSVSWPYAAQLSDEFSLSTCSAMLAEENRVNYWKQERGTSMSTPFVAGSIALWLEANPDLSVHDVKDIIARTAVADDDVLCGNPVQWGAGKFNALAGLKEALRLYGSSPEISDSSSEGFVMSRSGRNHFDIFSRGEASLSVKVVAVDGSHVLDFFSDSGCLSVNLDCLNPGVYFVVVNGSFSRKVLLI